jgi:hypothetical protein
MLFSSLSFLLYSRFGRFFVVLFSSLSFLLYSWFGRFFVVLFSSLRFLLYSWFSGFFVVLFSSLSFLLGWCCRLLGWCCGCFFSLQLCDVSYGEPLLLAQRWWLQQARQPVQQLR